mmetsp:Transcript_14211/g.24744  ORF Transcript_14211/g.24744 Transcript_14211/m.24744 type:complete len:236 (-) Transcript_14211:50-757(-)
MNSPRSCRISDLVSGSNSYDIIGSASPSPLREMRLWTEVVYAIADSNLLKMMCTPSYSGAYSATSEATQPTDANEAGYAASVLAERMLSPHTRRSCERPFSPQTITLSSLPSLSRDDLIFFMLREMNELTPPQRPLSDDTATMRFFFGQSDTSRSSHGVAGPQRVFANSLNGATASRRLRSACILAEETIFIDEVIFLRLLVETMRMAICFSVAKPRVATRGMADAVAVLMAMAE